MNELVVSDTREVTRAERVRRDILALKVSMTVSFFEIGDLLSEAKNNGYYQEWGYENFGSWVKENMDKSERQAYYLIKIVEGHKKLGIPRNALLNVNISKLKSIFRLDPEKYEKEMRELLAAAPLMTPDQVEAKVQEIEGDGLTVEPLLWLTVKVTVEVKEMAREAFNMVRDMLGKNTSDSVCLEYILADFVSGTRSAIAAESQAQSDSLT